MILGGFWKARISHVTKLMTPELFLLLTFPSIGIDFTQSNGDPTHPSSLHFVSNQAGHLNEYALSIKSVGEIIQDYDTDKLFPVYGFGARLPPNGLISHKFNVNFQADSPNCHKIDGCLEAYQRCIRSVQLWGPTNFAPIINKVSNDASQDYTGRQYWVLMMITDGIISDMEQTKKAIVNAAKHPMSIIIIGVGQADFSAMEILDGDDVRLSYNGIPAERDIVQFVPMREFVDLRSSHSNISAMTLQQRQLYSQARLAQEVLQEIPSQVCEWMKINKKIPFNMTVNNDDNSDHQVQQTYQSFQRTTNSFIRASDKNTQYVLEA